MKQANSAYFGGLFLNLLDVIQRLTKPQVRLSSNDYVPVFGYGIGLEIGEGTESVGHTQCAVWVYKNWSKC